MLSPTLMDDPDVPAMRRCAYGQFHMDMGRIRIGCAGWGIPREHSGMFQQHGTTLERYASCMDVVEINSSFYRPHQPTTYARWAASVPADFRFSVKMPKTITHKRGQALLGTAPLVDAFLGECMSLGNKLGCLLAQLPPSLAFDARRANAFFGLLRRRLPDEIAIACEPRHPSWASPKSFDIWQRHQVTQVIADPAPYQASSSGVPVDEAGLGRYWRLHGSPRMYYSAYSNDTLEALSTEVLQAARSGDAWVIFDNTAHGHALANALTLKTLVASAPTTADKATPHA